MNNNALLVTAECRNNPTCEYTGEDIVVDITVRNISADIVYFPLAYLKARGPAGTLINNRSKAERPLQLSLAPHELKEEFTLLKPSQAVTFDTQISRSEILALESDYVDVTAVISPAVNIKLAHDTRTRPFRGSAELHISDRMAR
jgi:hypothetical protein